MPHAIHVLHSTTTSRSMYAALATELDIITPIQITHPYRTHRHRHNRMVLSDARSRPLYYT